MIVAGICIVGRRDVEAAVEVAPVVEMWAMKGVTAAMEDGCRAKAAAMEGVACAKASTTVNRHPAASESSAVKCRATSTETAAAVKRRAASTETAAAVKRRAAARSAAASEAATAAKTATPAATAAARCLNLGRQPVGCKFR